MARVPASEATRNRVEQMVNGAMGELDKSELIREAVRLIVGEALEGEVSDAVGRDYYRHGERGGYRNVNAFARG